MSLTIGFDTGIKSLLASQAALQTIGNNIANANTPGFSREQIILGETSPISIGGFSLGTGVSIAQIRRIVDDGLEQRILYHRSGLARFSTEAAGYKQIENIWNGAGGNGLPASLSGIFNKLSSLGTQPDGKAGRQGVLTSAGDLAAALRGMASSLGGFRDDSRFDTSLRLDQANNIAAQIAQLNNQIGSLTSQQVDAHALEDRRQQLLNDLNQIVEATVIPAQNGMVRVLVGGQTIVGGTKTYDLYLDSSNPDKPELRVRGAIGAIAAGNGAIAGLMKLSEEAVPSLLSKADDFTRELILAFNRLHTTGVPLKGGFEFLQGASAPKAGAAGMTLPMSAAGLPFEVKKGDLFVTTTNNATGDIVKTKITINPSDSMVDFAAKINGVPHLSATMDAAGRMRISADSGYQFDFSPRLDVNPDAAGAFGGSSGAVSTAAKAPFTLAAGSALQVKVDGGATQNITFNTSQFADISAATAGEVAAAINAQLTGAKAVVAGGALSIVSLSSGSTSSIQITDGGGAPNAALQFSTAIDTGSPTSAHVAVSGSYTGGSNDAWTFKADANGQIGVTPNLTVGVYDSAGNRIATLAVGEGYAPGSKLAIKDGVEVSFGPGELSQTANDQFSLDVIANSDSSDVLTALGLNTLFTGSGIDSIAIREDLAANSDLLATSLTGAPTDTGNVNRFLALQKTSVDSLGGTTLAGVLIETTADLASTTRRAIDLESAQNTLVNDLGRQREQISGVSLEEEMANMVRFQQSFSAAGRFIRVLQETSATLLELVR